MKLLVTGGAGFIGTNFIRYYLQHDSDDVIVNFDLLTYAGNLSNLADIAAHYPKRYKFVQGDILDAALVENILKKRTPRRSRQFRCGIPQQSCNSASAAVL